jgi:hypothetical protein
MITIKGDRIVKKSMYSTNQHPNLLSVERVKFAPEADFKLKLGHEVLLIGGAKKLP